MCIRDSYDEALADFDRAIELDQKYAWAIAQRGETYRLMEHYDEALADFDRAVELDPTSAWTVINQGRVLKALTRYELSLSAIERAIVLNSQDDWFFYERAIVRQKLDPGSTSPVDLQQAITMAHDAYQTDPLDWHNLFNLALYYVASGEEALAEELYRVGSQEQPGTVALQVALRDLDDYLRLFPDDAAAARLRALLQACLLYTSRCV